MLAMALNGFERFVTIKSGAATKYAFIFYTSCAMEVPSAAKENNFLVNLE